MLSEKGSRPLCFPPLAITGDTVQGYFLEVPISVNLIFTVDPVKLIKSFGAVNSNINGVVNFYQNRGGSSRLRVTPPGVDQEMSTAFSRKLKGSNVIGASFQYLLNFTSDDFTMGTYLPLSDPDFDPDQHARFADPWLPNHDTAPWQVYNAGMDGFLADD